MSALTTIPNEDDADLGTSGKHLVVNDEGHTILDPPCLISAAVIKRSFDEPVGLSLKLIVRDGDESSSFRESTTTTAMTTVVENISQDSPFRQTSLRVGDELLTVNGQRCRDPRKACVTIAQISPGEELLLTALRGSRVAIHDDHDDAANTIRKPTVSQRLTAPRSSECPQGGIVGLRKKMKLRRSEKLDAQAPPTPPFFQRGAPETSSHRRVKSACDIVKPLRAAELSMSEPDDVMGSSTQANNMHRPHPCAIVSFAHRSADRAIHDRNSKATGTANKNKGCYSESPHSVIHSSTRVPFPGARFDSIEATYEVKPKIIGSGSFGTVRDCIHRRTRELFAVKSILKESVKHQSVLENEIKMLRQANHRNIVRTIDVIEDMSHIHIVMEKCTGGDLFEHVVEQSARLDEGRVADIIRSVLDAVCYLHAHNIVHRDLKLENLMLASNSTDATIKVIDFGLAVLHDPKTGDDPLTLLAGSLLSVAPEMIRRRYGKECDIWSVGTIAYILLTTRRPFNGSCEEELFPKIKSGKYDDPQSLCKNISSEAKDFISCLLTVDPKERWTAEQARVHPWITKNTQIANKHVKEGCTLDDAQTVRPQIKSEYTTKKKPPEITAKHYHAVAA